LLLCESGGRGGGGGGRHSNCDCGRGGSVSKENGMVNLTTERTAAMKPLPPPPTTPATTLTTTTTTTLTPSKATCRRRRKRSLTGLELYYEWNECYTAGWHHELMQLEGLDDVNVIVSRLSSCATEMPGFVEFAAFHNSQLMQPMPRVEHALQAMGH